LFANTSAFDVLASTGATAMKCLMAVLTTFGVHQEALEYIKSYRVKSFKIPGAQTVSLFSIQEQMLIK